MSEIDFTLSNTCTAIVARRGSGKTTLLAHLLNVDKTKFAAIFVVSGSESVNNYFHSIKKINPKHIFTEWNEELMQGIFDEIKNKNAGIAIGKQKKYLLILDDLISESNFTYNTSKCIMKQYCVGRHISYGILTISQHLNKISKLERSNLSFIFVSSMSASCVDSLIEEYCISTVTKRDFKDMFHEATRDFGFMLINNQNSKTNSLAETYGIVRAPHP
jgi:energy-coupling factor transporter ATP-binding protein EcfA2